ncbi:MAG: hypothetical protein IT210_07060 [Armatimonadetes bacterium]|nr:hypothetical protein [Armatimonadota bacterium]
MADLHSDTRPEAERALLNLLRQAPAWRRLAKVGSLNRTVRGLALSGLRERYPAASPSGLRSRLAALLLGEAAASLLNGLSTDRRFPVNNDDPIEVTLHVTAILEGLDIPHYIGGSLASALYGVARSTNDADIVADIAIEQIEPLLRRLGEDFYADAGAIRDAIIRKASFNLIHLETMFKVDIFILKDRPFSEAELARRIRHIATAEPERTAYFASLEDTVLSKLLWYKEGCEMSDRQWEDILGVLKVQAGRWDSGYLRRWARELAIEDLLDRALAEASSA